MLEVGVWEFYVHKRFQRESKREDKYDKDKITEGVTELQLLGPVLESMVQFLV